MVKTYEETEVKIIDYTTFREPTLRYLEKTIRQAISQGWQPISGPVQSEYGDWVQAMVKYRKTEQFDGCEIIESELG